MKTNLLKGALITILLALPASPFDTCFGQGSLTPPGAPAPTMKTLSQIEPRIIINAAGTPGDSSNLFNITQPGSYYLTTNIYVTQFPERDHH